MWRSSLYEIGEENIFIFGLKAEEVRRAKRDGYQLRYYYDTVPELRKIIDMIAGDFWGVEATPVKSSTAPNAIEDFN